MKGRRVNLTSSEVLEKKRATRCENDATGDHDDACKSFITRKGVDCASLHGLVSALSMYLRFTCFTVMLALPISAFIEHFTFSVTTYSILFWYFFTKNR